MSTVRKRDLVNSARIISYIGGTLYILAAALLFLDVFEVFSLGYVGVSLLLFLFNINVNILVHAIVCIVIGAGIIILIGAEPSHLLTGIILLVLAIVGLGLIAIFPLVGGTIFIIAYTKKR
jgi:hypothetical protein